MDLVTMDILSGLPTADDGSKYLLVVVDAFTKWVEAYPLPNQEAATCITAVYNGMFSRFGLPRQLHSDQGRNFESQLVTELCNFTGVYRTRTTAFHPRSDGLTERERTEPFWRCYELLRTRIQRSGRRSFHQS